MRICKTLAHELLTQLCCKLQLVDWWLYRLLEGAWTIPNSKRELVPKGKVTSLESPLHYDSMSTRLSIHSFIL